MRDTSWSPKIYMSNRKKLPIVLFAAISLLAVLAINAKRSYPEAVIPRVGSTESRMAETEALSSVEPNKQRRIVSSDGEAGRSAPHARLEVKGSRQPVQGVDVTFIGKGEAANSGAHRLFFASRYPYEERYKSLGETASTDRDGRVEFPPSFEGGLIIAFEGDAFAWAYLEPGRDVDADEDTLLLLSKPASLGAIVLDSNKSRLPGVLITATVSLEEERRSIANLYTNLDGAVSLDMLRFWGPVERLSHELGSHLVFSLDAGSLVDDGCRNFSPQQLDEVIEFQAGARSSIHVRVQAGA